MGDYTAARRISQLRKRRKEAGLIEVHLWLRPEQLANAKALQKLALASIVQRIEDRTDLPADAQFDDAFCGAGIEPKRDQTQQRLSEEDEKLDTQPVELKGMSAAELIEHVIRKNLKDGERVYTIVATFASKPDKCTTALLDRYGFKSDNDPTIWVAKMSKDTADTLLEYGEFDNRHVTLARFPDTPLP